jgi:hypothetical protein
MSGLILEPNLARADDVYQWLMDAHAGRNDEESARLNARLILLLANHIGNPQIIREAIACAASIKEERVSQCT